MLAPGLIKVAKHPEHGEPVDYQPGQLLPEWLSDMLESGQANLSPMKEPGYFELVVSRPKPVSAKSRQGSVKR
jgi:hypothetical protein